MGMEILSQSLPVNAAAACGGPGQASANPALIGAEGDNKDQKIGGPGLSSAEGDNKDRKIGGPGPSSANPSPIGAEGDNKDQKIGGPDLSSADPPYFGAQGDKDRKIGGLKLGPIGPPSGSKARKMRCVEQLVLNISNSELRENTLFELAKKRELFQDLAPLLWNSFGTIAALLQEIVSIYPVLSPPTLTPTQSNRVCNALALLQCVASHADTRMLFLKAQMPLYLYPFLNTTSKSRPFEYLRLTSLGVIGALVKVDDTEVISFLLSTEIIPLCLRTMEMGSELSKTVATFIVQKILLDDVGLDYICTTAERFFAVGRVLGNMVESLAEQPSSRLLKHIIRCYLRLSDNSRACDALRSCLPDILRDATFSSCLREDPTARRWLQQLLLNVQVQGPRVPLQAGAGFDHMLASQLN